VAKQEAPVSPAEKKRMPPMDDELKTIGRIMRLLNSVPEPSRARVVRYFTERFSQDNGVDLLAKGV
jgi:hypothetical protein